MKILLFAAGLFLALPLLPARAQPQDPRPDLVITGVAASATRVGVGDSFSYTVTARNNGGSPCNWLNISMSLPGEVNLTGTSSSAPLSCEPLVQIVGQPLVEICRGGPGFFLWPGQSVTTTYTVRALRAASGVTATATVDPGNRCFESREGNNTAVSAATSVFLRPCLVMTLNKPGPASGGGRAPVTQVFPVTIANRCDGPAGPTGPIGPTGPAVKMALVVLHNLVPGSTTMPDLPELLVTYPGPLLPLVQAPSNPLAPHCFDLITTAGSAQRKCLFDVILQPGETLQARYRFLSCPNGSQYSLPFASDIRASTADDITQDSRQKVSLHDDCNLP